MFLPHESLGIFSCSVVSTEQAHCDCRCVAPPPPPPPCLEDVFFAATQWDDLKVKCNTPGWQITHVHAAWWGNVQRCPSGCQDTRSLRCAALWLVAGWQRALACKWRGTNLPSLAKWKLSIDPRPSHAPRPCASLLAVAPRLPASAAANAHSTVPKATASRHTGMILATGAKKCWRLS